MNVGRSPASTSSLTSSSSNGHNNNNVTIECDVTLLESIKEKLSSITPPNVRHLHSLTSIPHNHLQLPSYCFQVLNICARTALIQGRQIDLSPLDLDGVLPGNILYDVRLQDKTRENKFLAIYLWAGIYLPLTLSIMAPASGDFVVFEWFSGECAEVRLTELKPATDYAVKWVNEQKM